MAGKKRFCRRFAALIVAGAACALASAPTAGAVAWDQAGALPPALTPPATVPDPLCTQSYADDAPEGGDRLRFGIGPRLAGEGGTGQQTPTVAQNPRMRDLALLKLAGDRDFTVRLNRLFMADGSRGISNFRKLARHYGRLGLKVELQVRYHPAPGDEGDMGAWLDYVRQVVRAFGPVRAVTGLQITNEVNLTFSPNTSDGAYAGALEALVEGVELAKSESEKLGYDRLEIGFNFAWRFGVQADADFWSGLGELGGRAFRRATDWVGIDIYPGTFVPARATIVDYGDAFLEGIAQMRECYMPMAGFGPSTPLRIEETGWPTGPGRGEAEQKSVAAEIVRTASDWRGTYNLTDLRWFGLRDNNSQGPNFQTFFGLLRDDYSRKPAFGEYRRLVKRLGAPAKRAGR